MAIDLWLTLYAMYTVTHPQGRIMDVTYHRVCVGVSVGVCLDGVVTVM